MNTTCKNFDKCPIYRDVLKDQNTTAEHYKDKYCNAGQEGWQQCKRYLVSEKCGMCPPSILPNTFRSVDEIIAEIEMLKKLQ